MNEAPPRGRPPGGAAAPAPARTTARVVTDGNTVPAVAGILYVLVSLAGVFFEFDAPDALDTPTEAATGFVEQRSAAIAAATLFVAASALFLMFLVGLSALLHRIESARPTSNPLAGFVLVAGTCSIVVFLAYVAIYGALATSIAAEAEPRTVLALLRIGNAFDALSSFFQGATVLAASLVLLRRPRAVPGWIAWLGCVMGLSACVATVTFGTDDHLPVLGAVGGIGILLYVVWMTAVNVAILLSVRRAHRDDPAS